MSEWDWGLLALLGVALLVTGAIVVALVVRLVRKYRLVTRPEMPASAKVAFFASIAYTVFPLDLLPDPILIDDIAVLVSALLYVGHTAKKIYGTANPPALPAEPPAAQAPRPTSR